MKRKILKQTVAATVLTSSILTFSTVTYGLTTSIQQSIDAVKMEMKKATLNYVDPALNGEIAPSSSLYPVLNRVKKNVQKVRSDILSSNLSESEKIAKLKELDALYEEKITKGLIPYIDAYNYAVKYLDPLLKEIIAGEANNDFAAVERAYHKLSAQLKSRTSILYRFTGKAPRNLLLERYKLRADEERNKLMIPVTIYMKMEEAEKLFKEGKQEEAKKVMEGISSLIAKLSHESATSFTNELVKKAKAIQSSVASPPATPTPESPVIVPPNGGSNNESNTSPSESSAERTLRLAKVNAIVELEAYGKQTEFSEVDWSNILLLKDSGKHAINNSTSTTAVEQALLATKIEIDQVKTKAATRLALNEVIISAEQLLANHVEGTNVGQASAANRASLAEAIATAKTIYTDAANKTQADLENASTILTVATTIFEDKIVQAGDATALNAKIARAEQLLVNHIEGTNVGQAAGTDRQALNQDITAAKAVYTDAANKTQADLDNATTTLTTAITTFEDKIVQAGDATALNAAITAAEQLLANHVEGTNVGQAAGADRQALNEAITAAKAIYTDAANKTQADLNDVTTTLTTAITIFEDKIVQAGDATALTAKIATAEQLLANHVEGTNVGQAAGADRQILNQAISAAKAVYTDAANKTQADLDNATTTLTTAITIFEDKIVQAGDAAALTAKIATAEQLLTNHVEGTNVGQAAGADRQILNQAISAAKAVYTDAANKTQADLDNATTTLTTAITTFEDKIVQAGDATALNAKIARAEQLLVNHVEGTNVGQAAGTDRQALNQDITAAKAVYTDAANKTQADLDNATTTLTTAITTFEDKIVQAGDATALNAAITAAEQLLANHVEGTNVGQAAGADRQALNEAITAAKAIYTDAANKTQADLNDVTTTLTTAITIFEDKIVQAGDATALTAKIATAEQLLANHVEGTNVGQAAGADRQILNQAISAAKAVYTDAANKTQADLDNATTTLTTAITIFEDKIVQAGDAAALTAKIATAEQLLTNHVEGTNVGQAAGADRQILNQAISAAKAVYTDAANKTQADLDNATTTLTTAITTFEDKIVQAGDATALNAAITGATVLYTNAVEGVEVGQYIIGSKNTLLQAIHTAQLVADEASTKTVLQLTEAKITLDQALLVFEDSQVKELTGLNNITIIGTANDSSNSIVLGTGEELILSSSDENEVVATVSQTPIGTIKVTGIATGGPITVTAQVIKDGQVIKAGSFTIKVLAEGITSKILTNFDFSTVYESQAKLVSKPVTLGDFTGNRKDFTIVIGEDRIPINIYWKLSTDFPKGAAMGGVVDSHIQDYYYRKDGANGIMNRPIMAFGFDDTFQISAAQVGSAASFSLEGPDWNYFFDQSTAKGTDTDLSKNRIFTISDGINTATIKLTTDLSTIDTFISRINSSLSNANVNIRAEKVNDSQFKITSTSSPGELIIDGINKADFFE